MSLNWGFSNCWLYLLSVPKIFEDKRGYSHIKEYIQLNEYICKHKGKVSFTINIIKWKIQVEYYIKVLCKWANVDFEGDLEDDILEKRETLGKTVKIALLLAIIGFSIYRNRKEIDASISILSTKLQKLKSTL